MMNDREVDIRADLEHENERDDENLNVGGYEPLYQAIHLGLDADHLNAIIQEAPLEAKRSKGLFKLLKFAMLDQDTSTEILKLLFHQDPSCASIQDEDGGGCLLHFSAFLSPPDDDTNDSRMEFIELLLKHNPDALTVADHEGYLPLHHAAYVEELPVEALLLMLDRFPKGARMPVSSVGEYVIHMAAVRWKYMTVDIMQRIFDLYPKGIRIRDYAGKLPLHHACRLAQVGVIKHLGLLYPDGASVQDAKGRTPLHLAHEHRTRPLAVMKFLMDLNPSGVRTVDSSGKLPLHHTCGYKESFGSNLLRDHYYEKDIRVSVSQEERDKRYTDEYEALIHLLIDVYPEGLCVKDSGGRLPLHYACHAPVSVELLRTLLLRHPEHIAMADHRSLLPLHFACIMPKSLANIQCLLDASPFSVLMTTRHGETPLSLARAYRNRNLLDDEFHVSLTEQQEVETFLVTTQDNAVRAVHSSVVSTCEEIGFPDLVIARIWEFTKPNL